MNQILRPGEINVPLKAIAIKHGKNFSLQIVLEGTGKGLIVVIQPMDYNYETDEWLFAVGQQMVNLPQERKIIIP